MKEKFKIAKNIEVQNLCACSLFPSLEHMNITWHMFNLFELSVIVARSITDWHYELNLYLLSR